MEKTKILHIASTTAGGLGQSVLSLVTSLDERLYENVVSFGIGNPLDDAFGKHGIRAIPLSYMKRGFKLANIAAFWEVYRILRRESFAIVHVHGGVASFIGRVSAKLAGVPCIVCTLHGYPTLDETNPLYKYFIMILEKIAAGFTDQTIAISNFMAELWLGWGVVERQKIRCILHGIEPIPLVSAAEKLKKRSDLDLPPQATLIGVTGLLEERKGIGYLIAAMPEIVSDFPETLLVVVGSGTLYDELEASVAQLGVAEHVVFLGWQPDAPALMGVFDLFCLPSLREPFGLVLIEAMRSALPVVATRVGGIPEIVVDGQTGFLVSPGNSSELATAVKRVLQDPGKSWEMGQNGRRRFQEKFSLKPMIAQYEKLYAELVAKKGQTV